MIIMFDDWQVYPATLRLEACGQPVCDSSGSCDNTITVKTTIPSRTNSRGRYVSISYARPDGLSLEITRIGNNVPTNNKCKVPLTGMLAITFRVTPRCPDDGKTKLIVIEIHGNGKFWFNSVKSVWVSASVFQLKILSFFFYFLSIF